MNRTWSYLYNSINTNGFVLFGLIDPDKHYEENGANLALSMEKGEADAILVGGSTGAEGEIISDTIRSIKKKVNIPVIIFPGNAGAVSRYADAIFYLNIKNTTSSYWGSEFPFLMTPLIKKAAIEPIPVVYMLLEPGQTAGWISQACPFPRQKPDLAVIGALSAEYAGAKMIVVDSGSGSRLDTPFELISQISNEIKIPLIYGGGIKTPEQAYTVIQKGASGIQVGTAAEESKDVIDLFKSLREAMKNGYNSRNMKPLDVQAEVRQAI
ncbi:MAG: phosphoglycerol geranylgeranyltransferase [Candidatus Methanoperedens sp.]|nr:phosphoglycerol geranylgeranyltransferase [Candidatus Methanoperedens sp.]